MMIAVIKHMERIRPSDAVIRMLARLLYLMAAIAITTVAARPFFTIGINLRRPDLIKALATVH